MNSFRYALLFLLQYSNLLKADISKKENIIQTYTDDDECLLIFKSFAQYASDFTMCSILNATPIKLCENCIEEYLNFHNKSHELLTKVVNGTTCKSRFVSQDRLDVVLEYHDNIISIWNKGHCNACYDWSNSSEPILSNETRKFNTLADATMNCIHATTKNEVCTKCMQEYLQLDNFYKTLSEDAIGVDSICMDVVDSMNKTRLTWSKTLNCCKVRKSPEVVFLCCAGVISALPLLYYIVLRYFGPIKDFPNVLKQSRFKQTILRSINRRTD